MNLRRLSKLIALVGIPALLFLSYRIVDSAGTDSIKPTLNVMTYSSFMGPYGPGPELKSLFEKNCFCQLEFVNGGDSGLMLQKKQMLPPGAIDMVVGLDQFSIPVARKLKWLSVALDRTFVEPVVFHKTENFIPFDWAPLTFIHRGKESPEENFKDFIASMGERSLTIQDPRVSTPGLQFLAWIYFISEGDLGGIWSEFKEKVHSISPSWSGSYGLFQKQQVAYTFSYQTSPVYHWTQESDDSVTYKSFVEGHPYQIEFLGVFEDCKQCGLAKSFARFLLSEEGQRILQLKNFMLPTVKGVPLESGMDRLKSLKLISSTKVIEFIEQKEKVLMMWNQVVKENQ